MSAPTPFFFTSSILRVRRRLVLKRGGADLVPLRVRIGYFYHPQLGHTLIDTGYSKRVVSDQKGDLLLRIYRLLLRPKVINDAPLVTGLSRLGIKPNVIDTVIITHFHADHIGGLKDLPQAQILCSKLAWHSLENNNRLSNALEGVFPSLLPQDIKSRLSFIEDVCATSSVPEGRDLVDDGSIVAIALPGHLEGQIGVLFPKVAPPFLYAADVQWSLQALVENRLPGPPASLSYHNRAQAVESVEKVRALIKAGHDVLLCHDWQIHERDIDKDIPEMGAR